MTVTSTGADLDLTNTKCHVLGVPCYAKGVYLVTYLDMNDYGVIYKVTSKIGPGFVVYGSCEGHISKMRTPGGCGDLVYVSDKRVDSSKSNKVE